MRKLSYYEGLGEAGQICDETPPVPTTIRSNAFSSFLSLKRESSRDKTYCNNQLQLRDPSSTGYHELMEDITLPETNIDLENRPLEMESPIGNHHF